MSDNSCCELMNNLISQVEKIGYGVVLATAEEKLGIKEFKISQMSPTQAYEIYHSVYIKFSSHYVGSRKTQPIVQNSTGGKTSCVSSSGSWYATWTYAALKSKIW